MAVRRKAPDVYEVDSDTNLRRKYLVTFGTEGKFWSCTCPAYAIKRNRKGGLGHVGMCKHIEQVKVLQNRSEVEAVSSLRRMVHDLEAEV